MIVLKISISGYRKLKDSFTIDFTTNNSCKNPGNDQELFQVSGKVFMPVCQIFIGTNGSGKSTILSLLDFCFACLKGKKILYHPWDFNKDKIDLEVHFADSNCLYKYNCEICPPNIINPLSNNSYVQIKNQTLLVKKIKMSHADRLWTGRFASIIPHIKAISDDRSIVSFFNFKMPNTIMIRNHPKLQMINLIWKYANYVNRDVIITLSHYFGLNVASFDRDKDNEIIYVSDYNHKKLKVSLEEAASLLSYGTLRGLLLYLSAYIVIKSGGILLIDGLEDHLQHEMVINLIKLFTNQKVNRYGALLYFTTYDSRILDLFHRNDHIHIIFQNKERRIEQRLLSSFFTNKIRTLKSHILYHQEVPLKLNYASYNTLLDLIGQSITY